MDRRALLAAVPFLLAGCATTAPGGGDGDSTPTEPPPPRIVERSLDSGDGRCAGDDRDGATIAFTDDAVRIEGRVPAPTPCHLAGLAGAELDGDRLVVTVDRVDSGRTCVQCLAEIPYEATVRFEGSLPAEVVVRHAGGGVTTATR